MLSLTSEGEDTRASASLGLWVSQVHAFLHLTHHTILFSICIAIRI